MALDSFQPRFEGALELASVPDDFAERIAERVEQGVLRRGSRYRANYSVRERGPESISFGSDDVSTGINLGLNEVTIERRGDRILAYAVRFPVWARFVRGLSAGIALLGAAAFALPYVREEARSYPAGELLYFGLLGFWGFVWPPLLIALHKRAAGRFLERVLREELAPDARAR